MLDSTGIQMLQVKIFNGIDIYFVCCNFCAFKTKVIW